MTISHKILKALSTGACTAGEIAEYAKEDRRRIVSNLGTMHHDQLVQRIPGLDGTVEYKITDKGRQYYQRNAKPISSDATPEPTPETPIAETPIAETPELIPDLMIPTAEMMTSGEQIVLPESPPDPDQYVLCRSNRTPKTAWQIHEMTLDAAKDLAMMDATTINGEVILYRLVPIGRAVPRVVFEEA